MFVVVLQRRTLTSASAFDGTQYGHSDGVGGILLCCLVSAVVLTGSHVAHHAPAVYTHRITLNLSDDRRCAGVMCAKHNSGGIRILLFCRRHQLLYNVLDYVFCTAVLRALPAVCGVQCQQRCSVVVRSIPSGSNLAWLWIWRRFSIP
jgi:hypothetical protein